MAKATRQNKDDPAAPNPNAVPNKDVMQRLNFLYQASAYLNSIPSTAAAVDHSSSSSPKEQTPIASTSASAIQSSSVRGGDGHDRRRVDVPLADLSRSYVGAMRAIGRKTVVKMDPAIKRTMCKGCGAILIPGCTTTVRVKSSSTHGHKVTYSCIQCKASRRIPAPPVLRCQQQPSAEPGHHHQVDANIRILDAQDGHEAEKGQMRKQPFNQKRKHAKIARKLPLFQQPGSIIYRGNERVMDEDGTP